MVRTRNVLVCLTAITLCLAGIALGKAVKQDLMNEDGDVLGNAVLNYAKGADKTEIQVNCQGLEEGTDYTVLLCPCDAGGELDDCIVLGSFTTGKNGKGHLHAREEGDVSDGCVVVGIVVEGPGGPAVVPCVQKPPDPDWPFPWKPVPIDPGDLPLSGPRA